MKTFLTCVLGLSLVSLAGVASAQNLLVNGGFDTGTFSGWTTNGGSATLKKTYGTNSPQYAVVFNVTTSPATAVISQSFTTTVGKSYELSFYYGGYTTVGSPRPQTLGVEVTGTSLIFSNSVTPPSYSNPAVFENFTDTFTATSTSTTLTFLDETVDTTKSDGVLDTVSVTAVPEPSTMALSAAGGLFSLLALRRRK